MTNVQTINKAEIALNIFKAEAEQGEDKLRARCIKRFKAELGMGDAGASTYFQNCKKKAAGLKVPHYYKRKTPVKAAEVAVMTEQLLQLTHQAADRWIAVQNGVEIGFRTRGEAQAFAKVNGAEWKDRTKAA
ncbi:hypothetical protein D3C75_224160 [compost metagenome]